MGEGLSWDSGQRSALMRLTELHGQSGKSLPQSWKSARATVSRKVTDFGGAVVRGQGAEKRIAPAKGRFGADVSKRFPVSFPVSDTSGSDTSHGSPARQAGSRLRSKAAIWNGFFRWRSPVRGEDMQIAVSNGLGNVGCSDCHSPGDFEVHGAITICSVAAHGGVDAIPQRCGVRGSWSRIRRENGARGESMPWRDFPVPCPGHGSTPIGVRWLAPPADFNRPCRGQEMPIL